MEHLVLNGVSPSNPSPQSLGNPAEEEVEVSEPEGMSDLLAYGQWASWTGDWKFGCGLKEIRPWHDRYDPVHVKILQ